MQFALNNDEHRDCIGGEKAVKNWKNQGLNFTGQTHVCSSAQTNSFVAWKEERKISANLIN